jgi:circadian clock protein KaiB
MQPEADTYSFQLYVAEQTERSQVALINLRYLCESHLRGRYELEVIDVVDRPDRAEHARILATPTVIRIAPFPTRRVIGDLSDHARAAAALGLPGGIAAGLPDVSQAGGDHDE